MSYSETITRTDLANVLNEVLPIYNSTGFTVESIVASSATSVSANGGTAWIQVRIPSDKDPVCVVGYYLNGGSGCSVYNQSIGHDSNGYYASFALRNGQTTANNVTITALVLCKQQLTHFSQASADYIVEQGTATPDSYGTWTYRKWNSGVAECWRDFSANSFAPATAVGGFYGRVLSTYLFPAGLFIEAPKGFFNLSSWGTGYFWGQMRLTSATTYQLAVWRNDNASSAASGSIYAIGRWK